MKARFGLQQQPVKITVREGVAYIFICLNETQGVENYPDMGEGQTTETYYEYDYNEVIGPEAEIPVEDIQMHPENYIDYEYQPQKNDPGAVALAEVKELETAIERGLAV